MIKIKALSGPNAGRTAETSAEEIEPQDLLVSFVEHGWAWEIDYSGATPEETFVWMRAEIVARIIRAVFAHRPVYFEGKQYVALRWDQAADVVGEIEDVIVNSGCMVTFTRDDDEGLVIETRGTELPIQ